VVAPVTGAVSAVPVGAAPVPVGPALPVVEPVSEVDGAVAGGGVAVGLARVPAVFVVATVEETVLGEIVEGALAAVVPPSVVDPAAPTVASADELGAVISAMALARIPPPLGERKVICSGVTMTMPRLPAIRSIHETLLSSANWARSSPFSVCRVVPCSIALPMLVLSCISDTRMATTPTRSTPRMGIHARPRTSRSVSV
jgi:hypothetical protein